MPSINAFMNDQLQTIDHLKSKLVDLGVEFGPKLAAAVLIMVVGFFVARWICAAFERWLNKLHLEPPVRILMQRVLRLIILLLFMVMALQNLGFQLLPLVAGLGVAGAGVALALQGVLGNLAAGLTIIFTKPFRVGEYVSLIGVEGRVESIELFSTKLTHPDMSRVVIPNRKIVGEVLHNYGTIRQLDITVGVAYDTDLNAAMTIIHDLLKSNSRILKEPAPVVGVTLLGDCSINICIRPWVHVPDFGNATVEINQAVAEAFRKHGVSIPFPQREVRLLNPAAA